jgi:hypothetical protein
VLVGISPLIFTFSRLVLAEIPATAFAVISVALLFQFLEKGSKGWLVTSGGALGVSFLIKALNPFVIVPVGCLLLLYHSRSFGQQRSFGEFARCLFCLDRGGREFLQDLLWWGLGLCLPLVSVLLFYEPAALYDQLVAFRADLRAAIPGSWSETWSQFRLFIGSHWGIWLLALGGIGSTGLRVYLRGRKVIHEQGTVQAFPVALYNLTWGVWLVAGLAMLGWHTPLFPHHFIVLLPPLILLGAALVANLIVLGLAWSRFRLALRSLVVALALLLVGAAFNGPAMVQANQNMAAIVTGGREQAALQLLKAVSNPDDFVMGDSQLLIFMADRLTPPPLGDVALVAIKANRQTSTRMRELTQSYRSPAVVQWSLRLPWLPEYLDWVQANYLARRVWDNDHIIYFGRRLPADEPVPNELSVRLGDSLLLRGFQIDTKQVKAGQPLDLKVYWQADAPLANNYTIFTQLLDRQGALAVGRDSQPLSGYFPTGQWPEGEVVTDIVHLPLPADLPEGDYTLITGMYFLETLERLPVLNDKTRDYVILSTVKLE